MLARGRAAVAHQRHPVRVITLGRFRVEVGDAPLRAGRKAQRRPIDLLKLLIARGGEAVSAERLAEDLWPDAEGDHALTALRTTVSRLRKLIGARAVLGQNGALTLNPEACWVDALVLPQLLADSRHGDAFALYQGAFLAGDCDLPPVLATRARLHGAFLRFVLDLGRRHEHAGELQGAMDAYRKGLEVDAAAEEIASRLMRCCARSDRAAEGIAVYRNCQAALKTQLGAAPSAATRAVHQELMLACQQDAADQARNASALVAPVFGPGPSAVSIAILPFEDLSLKGDHRRLATAIREAVISLLGALPQISLMTQPVIGHPPNEIADGRLPHQAGAARYLLRGNVMVVENRLRASVSLIDGRTGGYAWSEQLDHMLGNVIEAQDEVAIKVADGVAEKLIFGSYTALLLSPRIEAWKALALVRTYSTQQRRQDYLRARALISRIADATPEEPAVLAAAATLHVCEGWKGLAADPAKSLLAGKRIFRRLRARYADHAPPSPSWGWACALRGEFDDALVHGRREVDRSPKNFVAHAFLGLSFLYQDLRAEALARLQDAFDACPQPPHWLYKERAVVQFCSGAHDEAAHDLDAVLRDPSQQESDLLNVRMMHIANLAAGGRVEEARHAGRAVLAAHPGVSSRRWCTWHFQPYRAGGPASRIARLLVASGLPL